MKLYASKDLDYNEGIIHKACDVKIKDLIFYMQRDP